MPTLLECCIFTEADRSSLIPSKESDIVGVKRKNSLDEDNEDIESGDTDTFTTLRKSSAFTIERFSKIF